MKENHLQSVAQNWNNIWKEHNRISENSNLLYSLYLKIFSPFHSGRFILKEILRNTEEINGKKIIECGSGMGLISRELAKKGARVTLLDISGGAITLSKKNFRGIKAEFIVGSIFKIPCKASSFDIVWNAGVLEHFKRKQQIKALKEMLRILKPGGMFITFNPSTSGKYYLRMKKIAERNGTWGAGYEKPIETLNYLINKKYDIREYYKGYWIQFHYGKYNFTNKFFQYLWMLIYEIISPFFSSLNNKPGYFLESIIKK